MRAGRTRGLKDEREARPAAMTSRPIEPQRKRVGRPYSDQFDIAAVGAAIAAGETTPLRAYQAYAATAGRPYARSSFEQLWRNHARRAGALAVDPPASEAELYVQSEAYWAEHVAPKPTRLLTLTGDSVALRVK